MEFNFKEIGSSFMVMFAVINIIGSLPIIMKVKSEVGEISPLKISLISFGILVAFLFLGLSILSVIGIDTGSFAIAGSLIIFALAFEMIFGRKIFKEDPSSSKTASIVPLAFPVIAGAGTITTLISLHSEYAVENIFIALVLNMVVVYLALRLTDKIEAMLGAGGMAILQKVFGIILLSIAVKLLNTNLISVFTN